MAVDITLAVSLKDMASAAVKGLEGAFRQFGSAVQDAYRQAKAAGESFFSEIRNHWMNYSQFVRDAIGIGKAFAQGVVGMFRPFVDAGAQMESFTTRLTAMTGSAEEAGDLMAYMTKQAEKIPASLEDVVEAGTSIKAFGADIKTYIPVIADLAGFMGTTVPEAAQAFGRAFAGGAGAADIFREKGILNIIKMRSGIDDLTKLSLPEFQKVMHQVFTETGGGIAGMAEKMSHTWQGALSNIGDKFGEFKRMVGDIIFPAIKNAADSILQKLNQWSSDGTLWKWAQTTARFLAEAWNIVLDGIVGVIEGIASLVQAAYTMKAVFHASLYAVYESITFVSKAFIGLQNILSLGMYSEYFKQSIRQIEAIGEGFIKQAANASLAADKAGEMGEKLAAFLEPMRDRLKLLPAEVEKAIKEAAERGKKSKAGADLAGAFVPVITSGGAGPDGPSKAEIKDAKANLADLKALVTELGRSEADALGLLKAALGEAVAAQKELDAITRQSTEDEQAFTDTIRDLEGLLATSADKTTALATSARSFSDALGGGRSLKDQADGLRDYIKDRAALTKQILAEGDPIAKKAKAMADAYGNASKSMADSWHDAVERIKKDQEKLQDVQIATANWAKEYDRIVKDMRKGVTLFPKDPSIEERKSELDAELEAAKALTGPDGIKALEEWIKKKAELTKEIQGETWWGRAKRETEEAASEMDAVNEEIQKRRQDEESKLKTQITDAEKLRDLSKDGATQFATMADNATRAAESMSKVFTDQTVQAGIKDITDAAAALREVTAQEKAGVSDQLEVAKAKVEALKPIFEAAQQATAEYSALLEKAEAFVEKGGKFDMNFEAQTAKARALGTALDGIKTEKKLTIDTAGASDGIKAIGEALAKVGQDDIVVKVDNAKGIRELDEIKNHWLDLIDEIAEKELQFTVSVRSPGGGGGGSSSFGPRATEQDFPAVNGGPLASRAVVGGGGGMNVSINVSGAGDPEKVAREIDGHLAARWSSGRSELRRAMRGDRRAA